MRGLCPIYWRVYVNRWKDRAFMCRYGHVNIFQLLCRDPVTHPLTPMEETLFLYCLLDHVQAERKPFVETGVPSLE